MTTKFGPETKKHCMDDPAQRHLMLCPDCHETICASKEIPKLCKCYKNNYIKDCETGKYKKRDDCII